MKKMIYTKPLAEVIALSTEDILRTSTINPAAYDGGTVTQYSSVKYNVTNGILGIGSSNE